MSLPVHTEKKRMGDQLILYTVFCCFVLTLHAASLVAKSHPALCDPVDCSPQTPLVHEISQARILEWITISSSRGPSRARDRTRISQASRIAGRFFTS